MASLIDRILQSRDKSHFVKGIFRNISGSHAP